MAKKEKRNLTPKSKNFSKWYNDVVQTSELADYGPTKGSIVFRPYGFSLWENVKKELDQRIKKAGVKNAYFPLLIPLSFLRKEKKHVEGFSPELAVVTHGGGEELEEPLAIRPTSETVIYHMYSKWVESLRDLPLLINQWANVLRWEKRTRLFLRTTEFLWQEGHTCHATHKEAEEEAIRALNMYADFYREFLAMPGLTGKKSEAERFPGALETFTYESLMPDGKALQSCTSHDLGQHFSKPFEITFQDKNGENRFVWQTSWGLSTRSLGGLIMTHGDNAGLVLPPKVAPIQVVIVPIFTAENKGDIISYAEKIKKELGVEKIRVKIDKREHYTPGWKFNEWELKGVPIRIEVGEKELEADSATLVLRHNGEREKIKKNKARKVASLLEKIQKRMYEKAETMLQEKSYEVKNYERFKEIMRGKRGFVWAFWCGDPACEAKIKKETKATTRLLPLKREKEKGKCIYCGKETEEKWLFAQAY